MRVKTSTHTSESDELVLLGDILKMMILAEVALGEETGFDDENISEASSPLLVVEENDDDNGYPSLSNRKFRGLGAVWCDSLNEMGNDFISYIDLEEVKMDATSSNYSKVGSSSTDVHTFVCN